MSTRNAAVPIALAEALADRYGIDRELGRGGMATVFLAEDRKHGRKVALKVMRPDLAAVMGEERFRREIEIAARLTHAHIVPLHDSGIAAGHPYYVMPFIEGESLRARLDREGRLSLDEALRLTREVAAALAYAHHQGLVHRDVKPENVLLSDGIALVADFGIARPISVASDSGTDPTVAGGPTQSGAAVGTPRYMSPEQAVGGAVDGRSDLYSLACVLFEMLAGQPPFAAATTHALLRQHLSEPPRPVADYRPEVPTGIVAALTRSLAKLPENRFASVSEFAGALAGAATPATVPTVTAPAAVPNNLPKERTRFIGRDEVLRECARLLAETRLLVAREQSAAACLDLCGALGWFWQVRSHYHEGRERLDEAIAGAPPDAPGRVLARAIWPQAILMTWSGDGAGALPRMEEAVRLWREAGERGEVALALEGVGWAHFLNSSDEAACATFRECLGLQRERGDAALVNRAMSALAQTLVALAEVDEARVLAREVIAFSQAHGDRRLEHSGWHYLADCALIEGKCEESLDGYLRSLTLIAPLGDRLETSAEVQGVAMSLAGLGEPRQALRLAGAVEAECERLGVDLHIRFWDALLERFLSRAHQALGAQTAEITWAEGRRIPFELAVNEALEAGAARRGP